MKLVASSKADPGQSIFTNSGKFTIPRGVKEIEVFCVGGGSGGGGVTDSGYTRNGYGGGGGYTATNRIAVQGAELLVAIGNGGVGYRYGTYSVDGTPGGTSSVSSVSAKGGYCPNGGSGGGRRCEDNTWYSVGGNGGLNGSNSSDGYGKGQGTTTKAFGESNGTLYAGGGGGVSFIADNYPSFEVRGGAGGAGGGGAGGERIGNLTNNPGSSGSPGTGGGGGGSNVFISSGNGGSGTVIIRWGN